MVTRSEFVEAWGLTFVLPLNYERLPAQQESNLRQKDCVNQTSGAQRHHSTSSQTAG